MWGEPGLANLKGQDLARMCCSSILPLALPDVYPYAQNPPDVEKKMVLEDNTHFHTKFGGFDHAILLEINVMNFIVNDYRKGQNGCM